MLNKVLPHHKLATDSVFGPKTEAKVIQFQKSKGLAPTGKVDAHTWEALTKASTNPNPNKPKATHEVVPEDKKVVKVPPISTEAIPATKVNSQHETKSAISTKKTMAKDAGKGISKTNEYDNKVCKNFTEFKSKYGSMIEENAKELGIDPNVLGGVIYVESGGSGFVNGNLKIRFEAHKFDAKTDDDYSNLFTYNSKKPWLGQKYRGNDKQDWQDVHVNGQKGENKVFEFAKGLNEEKAYESISMGAGQIMGESYKALGYKSAKDMYNDFSKSQVQQINGMVNFIKSKGLVKDLQKDDFAKFVAGYNGRGKVKEYTKSLNNATIIYKNAK